MKDSKALRRRAEQARRAASIHTYGDTTANRELATLADQLDYEAGEKEREERNERRSR